MPHGGVEHLLMQRRQSRENAVRSYADGGSVQATAQKLQGMGRNGDTILAHINPEEAALLKRMGGSGKINPNTGLMSFEPGFGSYGSGATGNYGEGKTDTSGGPGSAPGGDGSSSGSQGPGAGAASSGSGAASSGSGKTDTSGGPGSAPGGDGSSSGSKGPGAGSGSMPSGGITTIPKKDLPAISATDVARERAKYIGTTKIPDNVRLAFNRGMIPIEGGLDAQGNPLTSEDNAHGIAQVTDTTAPEAAADAGLTWDKNKYLTDTNYNYSIGLGYFNKLVKQFGNTYDAAGAYNVGPGAYKDYLAGKRSLPTETVNYQANFQKAMADPDAGFDTSFSSKPTDPLKALSATNVPTEKNWLEKAVDDAPGTIGSAVVSAMFPPLGMLNVAAQGVNFLTGKKTVPTLPGIINDAVRGTSTAAPSTAPTAEEYEKYGAAGDGSPTKGYGPGGDLTKEEYQKQYGGSDKPLLGIESLDRSPLLPEIDPSVPTAPLFDFDYSKFGIKGEPFSEYDYSKFGIKGKPVTEYDYSNFGIKGA